MLSMPGAWASLRAGLMDALTREWRRRDRTGEGGRWDGNGGMGKPPHHPHDPNHSRLRGNHGRNTCHPLPQHPWQGALHAVHARGLGLLEGGADGCACPGMAKARQDWGRWKVGRQWWDGEAASPSPRFPLTRESMAQHLTPHPLPRHPWQGASPCCPRQGLGPP